MADVNLRILLSAVGGSQVVSTIGSLASSLGSAGLGGALVGIGLAAGAAAIAIGVHAVQAAGDFQSQTERLVTSAGELQSNLDMVRQGILQLSIDTGTSTQQLADAMYHVESSNYHAANGLQVLTAAAQGAKTENADLTTVTQALLGVMTNYHMKAGDATSAMNGLISVVSNGNTTLQALSSSMSQVLPTAASLGISFAQVGGTIDTMTTKTVTARQAAQNLAHFLLALSAPSNVAVKSMASVGLTAQEVKNSLASQGLPQTLQMIEDAVGKRFPKSSVAYTTALKNILGGMTGFKIAAQLTGPSLKDTEKNINAVSMAMEKGKGSVNGFAQIQGTFNFKMDQAKNAIGAVFIKIGTALLPGLTNLVGAITPIITAFGNWLTSSNGLHAVLMTVGKAATQFGGFLAANVWPILKEIGGFLAATFMPIWRQLQQLWSGQIVPLMKQLWGALQPAMPAFEMLGKIIGGIVVVAFGLLIGIITGVIKAISGIISGVITAIGGIVQFFTGLIQVVSGIVRFIWDLLHGNFSKLKGDLGAIWQGIVNMFQGVWNTIKGIFQGAWGAISGFVSGLVQGVIGFFKHLWSELVGHSIVPDMITGIINWFLSLPGKILSGIAGFIGNMLSFWGRIKDQVLALVGRFIQDLIHAFSQGPGQVLQVLASLPGRLGSFFGNLANQAITWGANILKNLASGIMNAIGSTIGNAMNAIGNFIGSHLPHSPAKMGPLRELATQGSLIPDQIAQGMQRGTPKLKGALQQMLALSPNQVGMTLTSLPTSAQTTALGGSTQQIQGHTFNIYINTMARSQSEVNNLVNMIEQELGRRFRTQTPGYSFYSGAL